MRLISSACSLIYAIIITGCCSEIQTPDSSIEDNGNLVLENDRLYLQVKIDTSHVKMLFDSGCLVGCIISDSLANKALYDKEIAYHPSGYGQVEADSIFVSGYQYSNTDVFVYKNFDYSLIAPDYKDDRNVWSFNLDSFLFSMRDSSRIKDGIQVPIVFSLREGQRSAPFVKLPLTLCSQGDTLETSYYYLLDTGTPTAFAVTDPPKELSDFISRHPHMEYLDEFSDKIKNRRVIQFYPDLIFKGIRMEGAKCVVDTGMRSMQSDYKRKLPQDDAPIVGTIGLRFLKHFNFDIDLAGCILHLEKCHREFPSKPQNVYDFWCNPDGRIRRIGIGSPACKVGLAVGDCVISINGIPWSELRKADIDSLSTLSDTVRVSMEDGRSILLQGQK